MVRRRRDPAKLLASVMPWVALMGVMAASTGIARQSVDEPPPSNTSSVAIPHSQPASEREEARQSSGSCVSKVTTQKRRTWHAG